MRTPGPGQQSEPTRPSAPLSGCAQHREEMTLLALRRKLAEAAGPASEQERIRAEIARLEARLGLD